MFDRFVNQPSSGTVGKRRRRDQVLAISRNAPPGQCGKSGCRVTLGIHGTQGTERLFSAPIGRLSVP